MAQLLRLLLNRTSARQFKWLIKIILKDLKVISNLCNWEGIGTGLKVGGQGANKLQLYPAVYPEATPQPQPPSTPNPLVFCPHALPSFKTHHQIGLSIERVLRDFHPDAVKSYNM